MILGIDTSLGTAVGAVDADGLVRADESSDNPLGHAEVIGTLLTQVLADAGDVPGPRRSAPTAPGGPAGPGTAGAEGHGVTHVAVGMGPGPFTGLRVGIAAARAFALGRGLPVVPVPSHDAAALQILLGAALADPFRTVPRFAVVTDARRREYAYSVYDGIDDDGLPIRVGAAALVPREGIDEVLAAAGAARREVTAISGTMVALLAARALAAGRTLAGTDPLYLRAPDVTLPAPRRAPGAAETLNPQPAANPPLLASHHEPAREEGATP